MSAPTINTAHGVIQKTGDFIYMLCFASDSPIARDKMCNDLQEILYDDIGSIGCFRVAPKHRQDLNSKWLTGARPGQRPLELMDSKDNEIYVAFMLRGDDSEYTLAKELPIISTELADFCAQTNLRCQQVDIRDMY